jgi:hypothetical protein
MLAVPTARCAAHPDRLSADPDTLKPHTDGSHRGSTLETRVFTRKKIAARRSRIDGARQALGNRRGITGGTLTRVNRPVRSSNRPARVTVCYEDFPARTVLLDPFGAVPDFSATRTSLRGNTLEVVAASSEMVFT